jgi:hypothetical protein
MKTAVIGSRSFGDYALLREVLDRYPITQIVSGGSIGADQLAEHYAQEKALPMLIYKPDYKQFGKDALLIRNQTMIDVADQVVAFWDGDSPGTAHALEYAHQQGKKVSIITFGRAMNTSK